MTKLQQLARLGQAIWLDYIRRSFITSGEFQKLVDLGVRGVTSNPSIFEKAIVGSADYDADLRALVDSGESTEEFYEALTLGDIRLAASILRPLYDETKGADGFVSLEVNPNLAHDTRRTISEAHRLYATLGRPNVMIKVPATPEGVPAIEALIADGINVNVTLIFSVEQYEAVAEAFIRGLEKRVAAGGDVSRVASVASFFVSRVDAAVDQALEAISEHELQGKIAVANAKVAYTCFRELFSGPRWEALAAKGARVQRPLWASTSTKNSLYPDTLYVDSLIGPDTVNTAPLTTINAFLDHGQVAPSIEAGLDDARQALAHLQDLGIRLEAITQKLQDDGVAAFASSFEQLMSGIAAKRDKLLGEWKRQTFHLGQYQAAVQTALGQMKQDRIMSRIWARDHTVWKPQPTEISNRLGWLDIADRMIDSLHRLDTLADELRADEYTHALLLGMGGSSLAPEVFRATFGVKEGYLDLAVLDSTDPGSVLAHAGQLDLRRTLFIVSTKSGGTVETLSFFKFFYNRVMAAVGKDEAGAHFVAITDPGSSLVELAQRYDFRATFLNDPDIGGRYSALSYFGLVPAALIGMDLPTLLDRAIVMTCNSDHCNQPDQGDNHGARLGAALGELAKAGRDKLTLIMSPAIASFGNWVEQLVAESTGKEGKGILPVVGEQPGDPAVYGADRLFVYLRLADDATHDAAVQALEDAGQPVVRIHLDEIYDLGGQFFLWEMATAIAGYRLGINPFDQPNVEASKALARKMVAAYRDQGILPNLTPALRSEGLTVYGDVTADTPGEALRTLLDEAQPGAYIALQAYVQPTSRTDAALLELRTRLSNRTRRATTLGYGPRFLHSTGQLHKGDAGKGLFIQLTGDMPRDAAIPDEAGEPDSSISFGTLKMAQALGDRQALLDAGRRVIRFDLGLDVPGGIKRLSEALLLTTRSASAKSGARR
ncbi:MAG TPA: bifunctional transaldolase/phosoglucose isomerase [Aggregatilineaceae bacterium]|nr:bifunctional transaldolase/phosoglucose isomerase [Aggregatilineaceae bacterium]